MKISGIFSFDNNNVILFLICTIIIVLATFVSLYGSIFVLFLPVTLFYYSVTNDLLKTGSIFLISLISFLLLGCFFQFHVPSPEILILGSTGLVMAAIVLRNGTFQKTVIISSLVIITSIGVYLLYNSYKQNISFGQTINNFVSEAIQYNIDAYKQIPLEKEKIDLILENKQNIIDSFTKIFPSLLIVVCVFTVWLNLLLGRNILLLRKISLPRLNNLSKWKAPEFIIWIFISSGALIFLGNDQIHAIGLNLIIIISFIFLLQGLAIISFIFKSKNVPLFFRFLLYFLIAVQQFFMLAVIAVGLFDIWVDFRKFFQKKEPTD